MSTSNKNARALALLDRISREVGLAPEAKSALIQLINPFADFEMQKVGYFDTNESSSVVQCVRFSRTVGPPVGLAVGSNWDAHIFSTPLINTTNSNVSGPTFGISQATLADGMMFFINTANTYDTGGVTVMTGSSGATLNLVGAASFGAVDPTFTCSSSGLCPTVSQGSAGGNGYLDGVSRVIGMGFEVHNTTAQISLQGAVAAYRLPQPVWLDRVAVNLLGVGSGTLLAPTSVIFDGAPTVQTINDVPGSLAEAMLLNGTHQWEAKDGVMIVPTLNDVNIPVQRLASVYPIAVGPDVTVDLSAVTVPPPGAFPNLAAGFRCASLGQGNLPYIKANLVGSPGAVALNELNLQHVANFNTGGAYFTGLSYATSLTVNSIFYIERFPKPSDANLVVLANPSPPYSSIAMTLYPEFMRTMPVGCKVGDNADGDWFFEAVKTVSDFLTPALSAAGAFVNPLLGPAATAFGSAASSWADQKLKMRNPGVNQPRQKQLGGSPNPQPKKNKKPRTGPILQRPSGYDKKAWNELSNKQKKLVLSNKGWGVPVKWTPPLTF